MSKKDARRRSDMGVPAWENIAVAVALLVLGVFFGLIILLG